MSLLSLLITTISTTNLKGRSPADKVQATVAPVKKKALGYIKAWAKQFEEIGDPNLGLMGELYDQLRAKSMSPLD